jgi:fusarinine C synthase
MLLHEGLDLDRFRNIWDEVEASTPILRSRIVATDKTLRSLAHWETAVDLSAYLALSSRLEMGPGDHLMRKAIHCDSASGKRYFVLTAHHAICDRASMEIVWRCLYAIFSGLDEHRKTVPFSHFLKGLSETDRLAFEDVWRQNMANLETTSFPALPHGEYQALTNATISKSILFSYVSSTTGITLPNVLCGAWAIVQSCYTSSRDVVFSSVVRGRNLPVPGIEHVVGPTISTIPVRLDTSPETYIHKFLLSVQQNAAQIMDHQHLGLQNRHTYWEHRSGIGGMALGCGCERLHQASSSGRRGGAADRGPVACERISQQSDSNRRRVRQRSPLASAIRAER